MGSRYDDEMALRLNEALDGQYGEPFLFVPMAQANVNARPTVDATRTSKPVTGRFLEKHLPMSSLDEGTRRRGTYQEGERGSLIEISLSIDDAEFSPGLPARRLDRFRKEDGLRWFEVSDERPEGQGRTRYWLVEIATP